MRTRQSCGMIGSVILSLLLMTVVFTPYLAAGEEGKPEEMKLIQAAGEGDTETVKALIDSEADVDAKDENGCTALMKAAENGRTEIVDMLLRAGAEVDAKDNNGKTAFIMEIAHNLSYSSCSYREKEKYREYG